MAVGKKLEGLVGRYRSWRLRLKARRGIGVELPRELIGRAGGRKIPSLPEFLPSVIILRSIRGTPAESGGGLQGVDRLAIELRCRKCDEWFCVDKAEFERLSREGNGEISFTCTSCEKRIFKPDRIRGGKNG
jgi:hypothetical protein